MDHPYDTETFEERRARICATVARLEAEMWAEMPIELTLDDIEFVDAAHDDTQPAFSVDEQTRRLRRVAM